MLVTIWVTTYCNLRCRYCYEGDNKRNEFLSENTANLILKYIFNQAKLRNESNITLVFHGGEPMLNMDIIRFIINKIKAEYKEFKVNYSISTNCYNVREEDLIFIAKEIDDITVSIDGDKGINDLNRINWNGEGTYDNISNNLKKLLSIKKDIRIRTTVTANNVSNLYKGVLHIISLGVKEIIPGVDYESADWTSDKLEILYEELKKIKDYLSSIKEKEIYVSMISKDEFRKKGMCYGGINSFHIDPKGDIYPCVYTVNDDDYKCGNVVKGIDEKKIKEFKEINRRIVRSCNNCKYGEYCISTRCKFINKKLVGDFYTASPIVCNVEHVKLKLCSLI